MSTSPTTTPAPAQIPNPVPNPIPQDGPEAPAPSDGQAGAVVETPEQALVATSQTLEKEMLFPQNTLVARLPVELDVAVPLRDFRVRDLVALQPGTIIASQWANGEDVPLASGEVQLAWSEFEVIDTQLAVRLTRLI